jgi:hypothetical protein
LGPHVADHRQDWVRAWGYQGGWTRASFEGDLMKQTLKGGDEFDCVSRWRKKGYLNRRPGFWKMVKRKMNKRFRKQREEWGD